MKTLTASVLFVAAAVVAACSSSTRDFDNVTGSPAGGAAGAASGSGGVSSTSGSGGVPVGGSAGGNAGSVASAGAGGVSGQGGSAIAGGSAGQAGSGGGGGSGGNAGPATPSAGCAKAAGRPPNGEVIANGDHYFTFPESYDGTKPLPVLWGFHGCGEVNRGTDLDSTEWIRLTKGTAFETDYVRAVPLSSSTGGCWSYNTDIARVKAAYDDLLESYCVDTGRNFATGHSSGAQFIVQILLSSHTADAQHLKLKGIAPVAASDYGPMSGPIPVMYIQGQMDAERGNGDGHETVARLRAANSCDDSSMPFTEVMGCQSGNTSVNPGCVVYDGCAAPTVWCSHNDPAYSGTMHGVPCFGVKAMHDFFEGL
jgi:poly(3-hydroxybutyrate) depolymerase